MVASPSPSAPAQGVSCAVAAAACVAASVAAAVATAACMHARLRLLQAPPTPARRPQGEREGGEVEAEQAQGQHAGEGVLAAVGNTPLVRLRSLSEATGCEVLAKLEMLNPGGSTKDRVAKRIVDEALATGALREGGTVAEGTAGSTGVSLAMVARAHGLRCVVALPDDAASEKVATLKALGAEVHAMRPVSITHPEHFVNVARRKAKAVDGVFCDQFENLANFRAHRHGTGAELVAQLRKRFSARGEQVDGPKLAFICGAGTGGTLAGVHAALSAAFRGARAFLADPQGSSLFNRVVHGVLYTPEEAEGKRRANPFDTVVEGVGLNRLTANFALVADQLSGAARVSDAEAVRMARFLRAKEGLWVGSSSAINAAAAAKLARALGPGHTVVTVLCDGGHRHLSKFWSDAYLQELELLPSDEEEQRLAADGGDGNGDGEALPFLDGQAALR